MPITLSSEQKAAVDSDDSRLCILACAGSGKTTTLTARIARLVNVEGVDPASIAAITFTVLAADRLKYELSQRLDDKSAPSKMFVGTIHAFCLQSLASADMFSAQAFEPITESQQFVLLTKNWYDWRLEDVLPGAHRSKLIEQLLVTFDVIKMNSVDLDVLANTHPEVARAFDLYQRFMDEDGYVDFADMLVQFRARLECDAEFGSRILDTYKYIFVDEYQDVDPVQAQAVEMLASSSDVCVVGDDDQAIYQFRGTDQRNLQLFSEADCTITLPLSTNRRCPANILRVAESQIATVSPRIEKKMKATCAMGRVEAKRFAALEDEVGFIVDTIASAMESGRANCYGQFGILLRSMVSYGDIYVTALQEAGIPYAARGARNLFATHEAEMLVGIIEWLAKDDDSVDNLQLLQPALYAPVATEKLVGIADASAELSREKLLETGLHEEDCDLLEVLHSLRAKYERGRFGSLLELIHTAVAALRLMSPEFDDRVHYNVGLLTGIVSEYEQIQGNRSFRSLAAFLAAYASKSYDEATPLERMAQAVNVLTVHQAKGLEFDYVFVPMLVRHRFPLEGSSSRWLIDDSLFDSARYHTTIENETRLFYVACTRARKALYLLASDDVGLTKPKTPSVFFERASDTVVPDENRIPDRPDLVPETRDYLVTGYSALEYYLTCPYRYQLIVEFGVQSPRAVYFQFGKLVHDVMARVNLAQIAGSPMSAEDARGYVEQNFDRYYKTTSMREYDVRKQRLRALKIIDGYFDTQRHWIEAVTDAESDFSYVAENALVRGRYDALLSNERGTHSILDYKTGKPHSGLRTDFQMQFYALAANEQLGIEVDEAILCYVESDAHQVFPVTEGFLDEGRSNLEKTLSGILSKRFPPTHDASVCRQCEVSSLCIHCK